VSYTSTFPEFRLFAYRKSAPPVEAMASPLYTAPVAPLSATLVAAEPLFQAEIAPSSVSKRKVALVEPGIMKLEVPL
jgi:hypothetical protein